MRQQGVQLPHTMQHTLNYFFCIKRLTYWTYRKLKIVKDRRRSIISASDLEEGAIPIRAPQGEILMSQMVCLSTSLFVILNLPGHMLRLYLSIASDKASRDPLTKTYLFLWQQFLLYLFLTRTAINFFIYLSSRIFRKEVKSCFTSMYQFLCCCITRKPQRYNQYRINMLPLYTLGYNAEINL